MQNSALKMLAQKAKKRLSSAGQTFKAQPGEKATSAYLSSGNYSLVATKQEIEEDPLFEKVKLLLQKGDVINPLAQLTDHAVFDNLSQSDKERYIIDISRRYNELKNYFLSEQSKIIGD